MTDGQEELILSLVFRCLVSMTSKKIDSTSPAVYWTILASSPSSGAPAAEHQAAREKPSVDRALPGEASGEQRVFYRRESRLGSSGNFSDLCLVEFGGRNLEMLVERTGTFGQKSLEESPGRRTWLSFGRLRKTLERLERPEPVAPVTSVAPALPGAAEGLQEEALGENF